MKILQKGFNYSQDGPGNRLVYHLQGCNFRCRWCSNPESMKPDFKNAKEYSADFLKDEILRSRMMFFDGGGVTFTGGEPTLQKDELTDILRFCRENGVHTAIETNGSSIHLPEICEYVDYLIMDIKEPDDEIHRKYTFCSNRATLDNFRLLSEKGRQMHIRIPLINSVNTDPEPFVKLFGSVNLTNTVLEILPYHEYGKCKWTEEYEITDGFVDDETLSYFTQRIKTTGIKIINT